jgi:hypothetical protein
VVDPGIIYVDCFRSADDKDAETFDSDQELPGAQHCWRIDNTRKPASIRAADGDLVVHPYSEVGAAWGEDSQAPFFYRSVSGDFLLVTRAEAVSTVPGTEHCLADGEAAGLALRRQVPFAWATLLVRPDLPPDAPPSLCGDEPAEPPPAAVDAVSFGFAASASGTVAGVGTDAEAYVALCRHDDQLYFLYRDSSEGRASPALDFHESFGALDVGLGPLDVGVTATARQGAKTLPEGHFNWLTLADFADRAPIDGCNGALEDFSYPEQE